MMNLRRLMGAGAGGGIPQDYIAYWSMDNISGSTLIDETGNYNGTIFGATQVPGIIGNALSFDGVNDYVNIDSVASAFTGGDEFCISAWFNVPDTAQHEIVDIGFSGSTASVSNGFRILAYNGTLQGQIMASNRLTAYGGAVTPSVWHHAVFNYDGATARLFLDDLEISSVSGTYGSPAVANIGCQITTTLVRAGFMSGGIDSVRLYRRYLSLGEINSLYNEAA